MSWCSQISLILWVTFAVILCWLAFYNFLVVWTNYRYGEDFTRATVKCAGKGGVYLDTLQPDSLARIRELEVGQGVQPQTPTTPVLEPPKFITHISNITQLVEGQSAHFEARLTPVNDPNLTVSSSSTCLIFTQFLLLCWNYCIWNITGAVFRWTV